MNRVPTITKKQMEDEINKAFAMFQEQFMHSVPAQAKTHIVRDILLVRSFGVLRGSELHFVHEKEGSQLIRKVQMQILKELQGVLSNIVKEVTGCLPASLHGNVDTRTGEMLLAITLCEDLEQKLRNQDENCESY